VPTYIRLQGFNGSLIINCSLHVPLILIADVVTISIQSLMELVLNKWDTTDFTIRWEETKVYSIVNRSLLPVIKLEWVKH
jgi:hypothetical protein